MKLPSGERTVDLKRADIKDLSDDDLAFIAERGSRRAYCFGGRYATGLGEGRAYDMAQAILQARAKRVQKKLVA